MHDSLQVKSKLWYLAGLALIVPVALSLPGSSLAGAGTKTISVSATTPFRGTGITLGRDQSAKIVATGLISYGSGNAACAGGNITPNGCSAEQICPVHGACGALVGRIGDGKAFIVGEHKTVEGPGALSLGINDTADAFGDNTGAFHVSITVARGEEVAKVLQIYSGHLYVRRDGSDRVSALHAGELIYVGDELLTTQDGRVALEFEIGGRVKVGPGATVTVAGERSVDSGKEEDTRLKFVTSGGKPSQIEIQTNGGVLGGIKG
jgi:hypothetical protein